LKKDKLKKKKSGEDNMGIADKRANSDPNHKWKRTLPLFE